MTGHQIEALRDALCSAFDQDSLRQLLRLRLEKNLDELVDPGDLRTVAFRLIESAAREGWEGDLIRASVEYNPGNSQLRRFCEENIELLPAVKADSSPLPRIASQDKTPASVSELVSILEHRALTFLKLLEEERSNIIDRPPEGQLFVPVEQLSREYHSTAKLFQELHRANVAALLNAEYIKSHEITNQIHHLLWVRAGQTSQAVEPPGWKYAFDPKLRTYLDYREAFFASHRADGFQAAVEATRPVLPSQLVNVLLHSASRDSNSWWQFFDQQGIERMTERLRTAENCE
jgi:hypothetical protein